MVENSIVSLLLKYIEERDFSLKFEMRSTQQSSAASTNKAN